MASGTLVACLRPEFIFQNIVYHSSFERARQLFSLTCDMKRQETAGANLKNTFIFSCGILSFCLCRLIPAFLQGSMNDPKHEFDEAGGISCFTGADHSDFRLLR